MNGFDPASYYTEAYFEGGHRDGYADYGASRHVLRREFAGTLEAIRSAGAASGRLLEVGCAYGFFLEEASGQYDVWGIEISRQAVERCHDSGLTNVVQGSASPGTIRSLGRFDVVVMLDTIEHLVSPLETLAALTASLAPGGLIVITTGDFASISARLLGKRWRLMTPPQHLWFFTPASVSALARRLGLEIVSIEHPTKIVPLSLIAHQLRRFLGLPLRAPVSRESELGVPVNLFDAMRVILRQGRA